MEREREHEADDTSIEEERMRELLELSPAELEMARTFLQLIKTVGEIQNDNSHLN